jgi:ATP-dependent DNA helicase 2 subunit 2
LKEKCLAKPGNPDFWKAVQEVGRDMSLISGQEANQQGGESHITENEAEEVGDLHSIPLLDP